MKIVRKKIKLEDRSIDISEMKIVHENTGLIFNFKLIDWHHFVDEKGIVRDAQRCLNEMCNDTANKMHKWLRNGGLGSGGESNSFIMKFYEIQAVGYHMYIKFWTRDFRVFNPNTCECKISAKTTWKMKFTDIDWIMNKLMIFLGGILLIQFLITYSLMGISFEKWLLGS